MPRTAKPDPVLLPINRPRCPDCQTRMITAALSPGPAGSEHRTFACSRCGHSETRLVASDPLQPDAMAWTAGEPMPPPPDGHDAGQRTVTPQPRKLPLRPGRI